MHFRSWQKKFILFHFHQKVLMNGLVSWHWNHKKFRLEKSPTLRKVIWRDWLQWRWSFFKCKVLKGVFKMTYLFQFEVTMLFTSFIKVSSFECKLFKRVVLNLTICLRSKVMIYFTHPWIKAHLLSENSSRELFWIQYPCFLSQIMIYFTSHQMKISKILS